MRRRLPTLLLLLLASQCLMAQQQPRYELLARDRTRLAEALRLADGLGERLWHGWQQAPFAILLVTPDAEYLLRHPHPAADFSLVNYDPLLRSKVYARKRTQNIHLLATFPLDGVPTIVVGQAENTEQSQSTRWVITLIHEHFHQLQYSQPDYYADVNRLELSRGDQTGMWMLNYAFPYTQEKVNDRFNTMSRLLAECLHAKNKKALRESFAAYSKAQHALAASLDAADYRYLSFQLWQEGIARYTEYRMAALAAAYHKPSKAFRSLPDYETFAAVAARLRTGILDELQKMELRDARRQRVAFYAVGAAEGLLLDRLQPDWRRRYFSEKFYLEAYFPHSR
jgi:hypothetical protein